MIAIGALCLFLIMALLTYGKDDPGWSHNSRVVDVQNFGGPAGSYSADILFMVLGYFAYIFRCCWRSRPTRSSASGISPGSGAAGCFRGGWWA